MNKIIKILSVVGMVSILFVSSFMITGKVVKAQSFDKLVKNANQSLSTSKYDEAISLYSKALELKDDNNVKNQLALAQNYKQYQNVYNQGIKLINDKKYSEAIQKLSTINQVAGQLYTNAQNKIEECKKDIINQDIKATNTAISNEDYDSANKYIADIVKLDTDNKDAKQLKTTIAQAQQKDKDEAEQKQQIQNENSQQNKVETSKTNNNQINGENYSNTQQNSIDEQMKILDYQIESCAKGSAKRRQLLQQKIDLLKQQ